MGASCSKRAGSGVTQCQAAHASITRSHAVRAATGGSHELRAMRSDAGVRRRRARIHRQAQATLWRCQILGLILVVVARWRGNARRRNVAVHLGARFFRRSCVPMAEAARPFLATAETSGLRARPASMTRRIVPEPTMPAARVRVRVTRRRKRRCIRVALWLDLVEVAALTGGLPLRRSRKAGLSVAGGRPRMALLRRTFRMWTKSGFRSLMVRP